MLLPFFFFFFCKKPSPVVFCCLKIQMVLNNGHFDLEQKATKQIELRVGQAIKRPVRPHLYRGLPPPQHPRPSCTRRADRALSRQSTESVLTSSMLGAQTQSNLVGAVCNIKYITWNWALNSASTALEQLTRHILCCEQSFHVPKWAKNKFLLINSFKLGLRT